MNPTKFLSAPIPGENLTQDTRKYAWHRPPQFPEFDDAFEFFIDDFMANEERVTAGITVLRTGIPATSLISTLLTHMVSEGRISPDMSIVLAGPIYKVFTKTMDAMGVSYLSGFDTVEEMEMFLQEQDEMGTKPKKTKKLTKEQEDEIEALEEELKEQEGQIPVGGLMGASAQEEELLDIPAEQTGRSLVEAPAEDEDKEGEK